MSRFGHAVTGPYRFAARIRRSRAGWLPLPAPSLSVGNLAFGGRCKTPLVAALAKFAMNSGRRVAILTRGYPVTTRFRPPVLLRAYGDLEGAPWLQPLVVKGEDPVQAFHLAARVGDEAPWLAAVTGAPVIVHPDRQSSAQLALAQAGPIDFLLLDDGFQSPVRADLDVVVVDPATDLRRRNALRESPSSLVEALVVHLGRDLRRRAGPCRDLQTGRLIPSPEGPHLLAAGVGSPKSVITIARAAGLNVGGRIRLRDHRGPSRRRLAGITDRLLVTEKDAVGWAAASQHAGTVLGMRLDGADAIWSQLHPMLDELG